MCDAQDRFQWRTLVNKARNIWVPQDGKFVEQLNNYQFIKDCTPWNQLVNFCATNFSWERWPKGKLVLADRGEASSVTIHIPCYGFLYVISSNSAA